MGLEFIYIGRKDKAGNERGAKPHWEPSARSWQEEREGGWWSGAQEGRGARNDGAEEAGDRKRKDQEEGRGH
eukprot:14869637-Heterocapsa_arctica.AAC.1